MRFVHAIPGAAALDIRIGDAPALPNVPFGVATEYVPVPAGTVALTASPAGRDPAEGGALVEAILTFGTGTSTTVAAAGSLDGIDVQVIADSPDPAPDPALVRVVNLAADAPALEVAPDGGEPLVGDVGYGDASVWVDIAAGDPDLELRAAGGTEVLLQLPPFTLGPGTRSTLFVIGSAGAGTLVVVPVVDAVDRDA